MSALRDVVAYLCENYPHKDELSKARLTKMVYLADWKAAVDYGHTITNIDWVFNNFGPYVDDVYNLAARDPAFEVISTVNFYGNPKDQIVIKEHISPRLNAQDKKVLDHVIDQTKPLKWDGFIKLVYSTFPVLTGTRGAELDLNESAKIYNEIKEFL